MKTYTKTYTKKELDKIIQNHAKWLINNTKGKIANLSYTDLSSADLRYADLRYADLRYADLRYADLSSADLRYANLSSADLRYTDLSYADLSSADLRSADLRYANLRYADLRYAYYNPFSLITQIEIKEINEALILELMRQDALICGEEEMTIWANGGKCPFADIKQQRAFLFQEDKSLWIPGKPEKNMMEIFTEVCKCMKIKT